MNVTVVPARELSPENISAWVSLQSADPSSDSPFFRPEFRQAVAAVRKDVEVAVLEENGQPVGFFPFQRRHGNVGRPVGGPMADFNGPILRPGLAAHPASGTLREKRLTVLRRLFRVKIEVR